MSEGKIDPFRVQTFYIDFPPHFKGTVLKVTGLAYEREVKNIQQAKPNGTIIINQIPGKYMPGTITITKVVTANKGLWDWRSKVLSMNSAGDIRVDGSITAYDMANNKAPIKWNVMRAWPSRIKGPMINIEADTAQEEIEICYAELKQAEY
ncbi:MAG: phage tail protein [Oscillochloris sp.]|nr:phage tail protein [Oscillochloris sp.]